MDTYRRALLHRKPGTAITGKPTYDPLGRLHVPVGVKNNGTEVYRTVTPAQIAEGQRLTREWKPKPETRKLGMWDTISQWWKRDEP